MSAFETPTERIFNNHVLLVNQKEILYKEYGIDFIRFTDPETGKKFEVKVKEVKERIKR